MPKDTTTRTLEKGDIFFFYRPKVEAEKVTERENVQRFFLLLAPDEERTYRLFVVGRKKLPEIRPGESHPESRNWALNVLTTSNVEDVRKELVAKSYATETKGERLSAAAEPVGEGRYLIVKHDNHTKLAYGLELPKTPGPAQEEFEIKKEASYIISVKNPEVTVPGFPSTKKRPEFPESLLNKFDTHRWVPVDDPDFLNYENAQILLLGARSDGVQEELGISIDEEAESAHGAQVCQEFGVCKPRQTLELLGKGEFPKTEKVEPGETVRRLKPEESPTKGGKRGGKAAATRAPSAAGLTKLLKGAHFPANQKTLIEFAKEHKKRVKNAERALQVLKELPRKRYSTMREVMKEVGHVR